VTDMNEKLMDEKFRARDLALTVAIQSLDKRLDSMNEFRDALRDQTSGFVTRSEYHAAHESLVHITDTIKFELSRYAVRVDEFDRAGALERAQLDKRLDSMTEFRSQLKDQTTTFVARGEYLAAHEALVRMVDQTRIDISRNTARVDELDRSSAVERAQLGKALDSVNDIRLQLKEQLGTFASRNEIAGQNGAIVAELKRLDTAATAMVRNEEFEVMEGRTVAIETKLANWEGRLWALGAVFLLINVFVSWYLSGRFPH
jgi:hypothetical protein